MPINKQIVAICVLLVIIIGGTALFSQSRQAGSNRFGTENVTGDSTGQQGPNEEEWRIFTNEEIGLSFSYPAKYGDVQFDFTNPQNGSKVEAGRTFGGLLRKPGCTGADCEAHAIYFGGITPDFRAPRGGSPWEQLGWKKAGNKYSLVLLGDHLLPVSEPVEEIVVRNTTGILISGAPWAGGDDPSHAKARLAVFNLKSSEFPAVSFFYETDTISQADARAILQTIEIK